MNFKTFFIIIGILVSITAIQAQKKIGYILEMDSVMKHQYLGLSSFQNFSNIYSMPFELQNFADDITHRVLGNSDFVLVRLEETIYQNYLLEESKLSRKEKKVFRKKWLDELKQEWGLDGFILLQSALLDPYQQENITVEMGRIGFIQGNNQAFIRVYLQMDVQVFTPDKVIHIKAKTKYLKKKGFPSLRSKNTRFTKEELLQTEEVYQSLIQLQLEEIKESKSYIKFLEKL
ncbi:MULTISPECIES: hypothetical protein [unclassified Lentimicrobium]|uniref:hypothetical protein n=1 Tax=unclassified Lentimicrobium TaxID=2677434 RepID=UPI001556B9BC|nr:MULTISPECIES: hypothetical protein [unclassified Lentimicrobium]NPD47523.1 hypothetical protein [Lentimicrobium sp. S6]NPD84666.1 hypothetical protein [Lentimicrobium sp. L6]